jgi:hypothetical protein
MKARPTVLSLALCLIGVVVGFAQGPLMGTWKLNEAKSKLAPGVAKNSTVVYQDEGDKVTVTIDGLDGDSKPVHTVWSGKFDGKEYPVTGDPNSDARSVTKINDQTFGFNVKKGGKSTAQGRIVVSPDGKSRTVTTTGTDANGKKISGISVYEKQ